MFGPALTVRINDSEIYAEMFRQWFSATTYRARWMWQLTYGPVLRRLARHLVIVLLLSVANALDWIADILDDGSQRSRQAATKARHRATRRTPDENRSESIRLRVGFERLAMTPAVV